MTLAKNDHYPILIVEHVRDQLDDISISNHTDGVADLLSVELTFFLRRSFLVIKCF